jgi:hypothetical protein
VTRRFRISPLSAARTGLLAICSLALLAFAAPAGAAPFFDYPNFSNTSGLQLSGTAKQEGNVLRLTGAEPQKSGRVFATTQLNPQESFENSFALSMHDSTCCENPAPGMKPADGMAFVIQSQSITAGEGLGGSLGYSGITPSVIVEFDIYSNIGEPLTDHIAVISNGEGGKHLQCANAGPTPGCTVNLPFPLYGAPVYAWVEYDATAQHLKVWASQSSTKPATPLLDYGISLASLGSSAWVGFTAATGSHNAVQDVLSWRQGALGSLIAPAASTPAETKKAKCQPKKKAKKGKGKKATGKASPSASAKAKGKKGKGKRCGKKKGHKKGKGKAKGK